MDTRIEIRPGRHIRLSLYATPHCDTTVFLIHGLGGRGEQWRQQISLLENRYRLVVPDLLGQGQSDKPPSTPNNPYSFVELEKDCQALFNRFAGKRNVIIGHSYGGAFAATLALEHQDKVQQLILISPIACTPNIPIPYPYRLPAFMLEWIRLLLEKEFLGLSFSKQTRSELITEEALAGRQNPMHVIKSIIYGMQTMPRLDITMLTVPTLIVLGEEDQLIPPTLTKRFYAALPNLQIETIPNAAHFCTLEQPQRTNDAILHFLTESTQSAPSDQPLLHS